jgi:predicted dehydrogenase
MGNVVRIGVIGAGSISVRGILPHLSQDDVQDRISIAAICDPVPGRADAAKERFGADQAFTDYEDLLANGDVDLVTLASPIGLHYEQGKMALEAGKHVHFNKTMTTTVAEATDLIETAKAKNLKIVASPGQMLRPEFQEIRRLIQEGAIGELCWAASGAAFGAGHESEKVRQGDDVLSNINPSWYYRKPGGGPLYDMTVYCLHTLTGTLGPVKQVTALSGVRIPERHFKGELMTVDADDNTLMLLDFDNSLFAFVYGTTAGAIIPNFDPTYFGTGGTIAGRKLNGEPFPFPGSDDVIIGPKGSPVPNLPHVVGTHRTITEPHVFEDIMQLVDWVREGKPTIVTAEHARHVVEIIEAAYRATECGKTQQMTTTF